jgi:hypothetical protein
LILNMIVGCYITYICCNVLALQGMMES